MITTLKLIAAGLLGWAMLNPGGFTPRADGCSCKADAASKLAQPRADDCSCKANANTATPVRQPRADDCSCKAKAD